MTEPRLNKIYQGNIYHRRFVPKDHRFTYGLFMLALDVKQMEHKQGAMGFFGFSWLRPLWFNEKDYLRGEPKPLSVRIKNKVHQLKGDTNITRITMLAQVRCFGLYFSPANFYFCYNQNDVCKQMLVEVSNTPWNERHYYLVNISKQDICEKSFQVSPFMDLNMHYHWRVIPPKDDKKLLIQIENHHALEQADKIFEASLVLKPTTLNKRNIFKTWCRYPIMTMRIVAGIYWQALNLLIKRIPFIGYQTSANKKRSE